jgi:hypothetical protein
MLTLIQELVRTPSSLQETVETLTTIAAEDDASKATKTFKSSSLEESRWYNNCPRRSRT